MTGAGPRRRAGYLFIATFGEGGIAPFFSHHPLIAVGMVLLTLIISVLIAGGNLKLRGDNGWVIDAVGVIGSVLRGRAR